MANDKKVGFDLDSFVKAYQSEKIDEIKVLGIFDELRLDTWNASFERANKEKDPADKYGMLSKIHSEIAQTGMYFAGKQKLGSNIDTMGLDAVQKINLCINVGKSMVDAVLKK